MTEKDDCSVIQKNVVRHEDNGRNNDQSKIPGSKSLQRIVQFGIACYVFLK